MAVEETRRRFFSRAAQGIGALALASLLPQGARAAEAVGGLPGLPHFAPKAKRCIYLHLVGAPPQMETFDYKPKMNAHVRQGPAGIHPQRPAPHHHDQRADALPHRALDLQVRAVRQDRRVGLRTAALHRAHGGRHRHHPLACIPRPSITSPAITFFQTGFMVAGRPCIGSWLSYGLGSMNQNLPTFVVLQAKHNHPKANVQAISARLWSAGFLSGQYSGVSLRSAGDPVLFINNPDGVPAEVRRRMLDALVRDEPAAAGKAGRPRNAHAHRAIRDGVPHASLGARTDRHQQRAREHLETLRRGCAQPGIVRPDAA